MREAGLIKPVDKLEWNMETRYGARYLWRLDEL